MAWTQAGLVILIGLGAGRFVWPRLRASAHPAADSLILVAGGCLLMGWYGGWAALMTMSVVAALASLLLDRGNRWRAGLFAALMVAVAASFLVR